MYASLLHTLLLTSIFSCIQGISHEVCAGTRWDNLPPTPQLPQHISTTIFVRDNVHLWFQRYNPSASGPPLVIIHGGLGYSAYFGAVITILSKTHHVIAVDRRGHGRSTYNSGDVFTFEMFAQDTHALLQAQGITSAVWVGWSDGAITAIAGLLDPAINNSISKAFLFAGSQHVSDSNSTFGNTAIYSEFVARCQKEYAQLQPKANFLDFAGKVATLESTLPEWSDAQMATIPGAKVAIVGADHDEAVNLAVPGRIHSVIKGSELIILKGVSHFAPIQDPVGFAAAVEAFL